MALPRDICDPLGTCSSYFLNYRDKINLGSQLFILSCRSNEIPKLINLYKNGKKKKKKVPIFISVIHSFVEIDHEIFSTVILSLPLIQEGQLSVSGKRMCTILVNRLED